MDVPFEVFDKKITKTLIDAGILFDIVIVYNATTPSEYVPVLVSLSELHSKLFYMFLKDNGISTFNIGMNDDRTITVDDNIPPDDYFLRCYVPSRKWRSRTGFENDWEKYIATGIEYFIKFDSFYDENY